MLKLKGIIGLLLLTASAMPSEAQQLLTLDSCRAMAVRHNKQLSIAKVKKEVATNVRKAARTKYLPHVSAVGTYQYTSREISLLNDNQKQGLTTMGTTLGNGINGAMNTEGQAIITDLVKNGTITMEQAKAIGQTVTEASGNIATALNGIGQQIVDAFRTDTRNLFVGSIMLTQPIFMGGKITAANRLADIAEDFADNSAEASLQTTLQSIDNTYWLVVSLKNKKRLAEGYRDLVKKLDDDVAKMIREGVATRSEGLSVSVKVNEAEMKVTQANDGLVLAKMLLCQLCGLPLDSEIQLADEDVKDLTTIVEEQTVSTDSIAMHRPELRMLSNAVDMSEQTVKLVRADYLPHLALTGGYAISNPNLFNGFQKKFGGVWNIGVLLNVPLWNWGEGAYKVRAAKGASTIANMELADVTEKIQLQVNQSQFKVSEAQKKLTMAQSNIDKAQENLRCANVGFEEGVINATTVMEAQTAWLQAQSQKIDAVIDVKMSQVDLKKALGVLN